MRYGRFETTRFVYAAAAIEMLIGLLIYTFPDQFLHPVYTHLRPYFSYLAAGFLAGAVSLLRFTGAERISRWIRVASLWFAALPMLAFAAGVRAEGGVIAVILYGVFALGLFVVPLLTRTVGDQGDAPSLFSLALGLVLIAVGGLMLVDPTRLPYLPIRTLIPLWGIVAVLGGVGLILPGSDRLWCKFPGWQRRVLPAFFLVLLALEFAQAGVFATAGAWAASLLVLLVPGDDLPTPERPLSEDLAQAGLEGMIGGWNWLLALAVVGVTLVGKDQGVIEFPQLAAVFVMGVSLCNTLLRLGLPRHTTAYDRLTWHLMVQTISIGLLHLDGGLIGRAFLAFLVVTPPLAALALGPKAGKRILGMAILMVLLSGLERWLWDGMQLWVALGLTVSEVLVLLAANSVGLSTTLWQRRLTMELSEARENLEAQVDHLKMLNRVGTAVRQSLDLETILMTAVEELGKAMDASRCYVRLWANDGRGTIAREYTAPGVAPSGFQDLVEMEPVLVRLRPGSVLAVEDVASDPRFVEMDAFGRGVMLGRGVCAAMAAGVMNEGKLVGVIGFHQNTPRHWKPAEKELLLAVSGQVVDALRHARVHRELGERLQDLQVAHEELQAQDEELRAQQEELQASNDELVRQEVTLRQQRDQLEDALESVRLAEEAERQLATVLAATSDFVAVCTPQQELIYLNEAARRVLGVTIEGSQKPGLWLASFIDGTREMLEQVGFPTAATEGHWKGEGILIAADRREIPVSIVLTARRAAGGEVEFYSFISRDITERKLTEEALREREELFRSAFENASVGMALVGLDGRWLRVNKAICTMLGYTQAELMATDVEAVTYPEDFEADRLGVQQMLSGRISVRQMEKRYVHKDGHLVWGLMSVSLVRHLHGYPAYLITQVQDITDRKRADAELVRLANYDALTGLFNRRRFQEEIRAALPAPGTKEAEGALIFLDLDQFKYVNDSLGHQAGDVLLKNVAAILKHRVPQPNAISRLGGDEFGILLPGLGRDAAKQVADEVRDALNHHVQIIGHQPIRVAGSAGIALYPLHAQTVEELLTCADVAMYQAKELGRNLSIVFEPRGGEQEQIEAKLVWHRRIQEALENDQFVLHSQPVLDLREGKVRYWELLIRMVGADGGLIPPADFLEIAENFGLIHRIDRWVVRNAIHLVHQQQQAGEQVCVAVNLSAKAFSDPELLPLIREELKVRAVAPSALVFEITESVAIMDTDLARAFIMTLKEMGCRFAIDDFGVGFSSFDYLKRLPIDFLKIDGSFIRNVAKDPVDQRLVKAMVEVATGLGIQTVAEFVEDASTMELLKAVGVDMVQGYHIGRPNQVVSYHGT